MATLNKTAECSCGKQVAVQLTSTIERTHRGLYENNWNLPDKDVYCSCGLKLHLEVRQTAGGDVFVFDKGM